MTIPSTVSVATWLRRRIAATRIRLRPDPVTMDFEEARQARLNVHGTKGPLGLRPHD